MGNLPNALAYRTPDHQILDLFPKRWSPRSMSGEAVSQSQLNELFEAARWAPSCYNEQEWRFLYAHRDSEHWQTFFDLLVEGNRTWCINASVLMVVVSKTTFTRNGKPNRVHSLDTGAAVQNLLLQATASKSLVAHAMAGFDVQRAASMLEIPDDYRVECMIAVGKPGDPNDLPPELREREVVSGRKKITEFAQPGKFNFE